MSSSEAAQTFEYRWTLGETEFGGFSPDTDAGATLFHMLGESGVTGIWLAEQLRNEAARRQKEAVAKALAKAVSTTFRPVPGDIGDQMILLPTMIEQTALYNGDEELAEAARRQRVKEGVYMARNEGMHPMVFETHVARAKQQVAAQLN